jgi:hypothetical protein
MPVSDDQLRAIGRITVSFNKLEYWINVCLWVFVNAEHPIAGKLAFEGEQFDRVLTRVKKLSDHLLRNDPTWLGQMRDWTKKVNAVKLRRNSVLHAMWEDKDPAVEAVGVRLLRMDEAEIPSTSSELNQLADDIEDTLREGITISAYMFIALSKPGSFLHSVGVEIREIDRSKSRGPSRSSRYRRSELLAWLTGGKL